MILSHIYSSIATFGMNHFHHLELYFAIRNIFKLIYPITNNQDSALIGAVLHTVNVRLFPEQLVYIVNHAEDTWMFFDKAFLPLVESLSNKTPTVKQYVMMATLETTIPSHKLPNLVMYESLVNKGTGNLSNFLRNFF